MTIFHTWLSTSIAPVIPTGRKAIALVPPASSRLFSHGFGFADACHPDRKVGARSCTADFQPALFAWLWFRRRLSSRPEPRTAFVRGGVEGPLLSFANDPLDYPDPQ